MDLEVLSIAANTDNNRNIENRTHVSKLKNSVCGDEMQIELILKNEKILDFGYQGKSCVYCQAAASLLSRSSINKSITNVKNLLNIAETFFKKENTIFPKEWSVFNKIFNKKNISRKECLLLPINTMLDALIN